MDALAFFGAAIAFLWIALAVAVGVVILSVIWITARAVSTRLEDRYLPAVAHWSRRRAGLSEDAGPWACPACHSVNDPTALACYDCGGPRADDAQELGEIAADPAMFQPPAPVDRFDPSLYRGPGAVPPAEDPGSGERTPSAGGLT